VVLFRIDPSQYEAALHAAEAQLTKAQADVEQAKAQLGKIRQDVARYEPLAKQRAIPQQDLENALASAEVAGAQVQQALSNVKSAQAAVEQARLNLGYTVIRSPISGIIGRREVDPGNLVTPQTLLVTVSNANPIRVHYDLSEVDYLRFVERTGGLRNGLPRVKLSYELLLPDGNTYPHKGTLYMVGRAVTAQTGTLPVVAQFPNPNNLLRPGQFVRVRVTAGQIPDAILVPQTALQELLGTTSVLTVGPDNKVAQQTVTPAGSHESFTIITGGLKGGERVIVEGQQKVRPGMTVNPRASDARQSREPA
jgi:membrane fusion protein (multidrug efflux system)